ncbi:topoisomerase [Thermoplasmatales archaeon ex4572_165]|nr:MAG: topoisomerase [Thermoplasmatales archaeon ex4572_165]RLF60110.1 MAG: topoisomerase [Thermoplasmata archaeon]
MNIEESLDVVEQTIQELIIRNHTIPIIVEGKKDKISLQNLGIKGEIIIYNKGKSLTDFCDWIAKSNAEVIILTDWDRRGGMLCHRMMELFNGRVAYDTAFREIFAKHTMIKTVEGMDSWLQTMNKMIDQ